MSTDTIHHPQTSNTQSNHLQEQTQSTYCQMWHYMNAIHYSIEQ